VPDPDDTVNVSTQLPVPAVAAFATVGFEIEIIERVETVRTKSKNRMRELCILRIKTARFNANFMSSPIYHKARRG
jgi:hypothetical protein